MQKKQLKILFTRSVPEDLIKYGQNLNLKIIGKDFIKISYLKPDLKTLDLLRDECFPNWVFTSKNAVKSLLSYKNKFNDISKKNCFAVGNKTAELISKLGFNAKSPSQNNAEALVELIDKEKPDGKFLYFCGNMRRNTLTNFFKKKKLSFQELIVYETSLVQPDLIINNYDAICFCSSSAVNSFFNRYNISTNIPCFAIGNSTTLTLIEKSDNVLVSKESSLYSLIDACFDFFSHKAAEKMP